MWSQAGKAVIDVTTGDLDRSRDGYYRPPSTDHACGITAPGSYLILCLDGEQLLG
jgi:hypothetical protein